MLGFFGFCFFVNKNMVLRESPGSACGKMPTLASGCLAIPVYILCIIPLSANMSHFPFLPTHSSINLIEGLLDPGSGLSTRGIISSWSDTVWCPSKSYWVTKKSAVQFGRRVQGHN